MYIAQLDSSIALSVQADGSFTYILSEAERPGLGQEVIFVCFKVEKSQGATFSLNLLRYCRVDKVASTSC